MRPGLGRERRHVPVAIPASTARAQPISAPPPGPRCHRAAGHAQRAGYRQPQRADRADRSPRHPPQSPPRPPCGTGRASRPGQAGRLCRTEPGLDQPYRHGLPRHHHPHGHPAQRAGKPRLVHRLHALPTRNCPRPAGGAAELPANGHRPHRPASGQCLAA
ncbi:hypothetical protein D9M73_192430 [compost metagenome]